MDYQAMKFEVRENVAWITINRPGAFNAINRQATDEFYDIVNRCCVDQSIRAVVLTGTGDRAFYAGGDVAEFVNRGDEVEMHLREMTTVLHTGISRLAWLRAPVIGAINGVAAGAGLSFAACCDLAIAADTARFTSAYTQIGLTPDGSSTFFLARGPCPSGVFTCGGKDSGHSYMARVCSKWAWVRARTCPSGRALSR